MKKKESDQSITCGNCGTTKGEWHIHKDDKEIVILCGKCYGIQIAVDKGDKFYYIINGI